MVQNEGNQSVHELIYQILNLLHNSFSFELSTFLYELADKDVIL